MARIGRVRPFRQAAQWEDRFWQVLEGAVPLQVRAHLKNARREILLAVKAVVDETVTKAEGATAPKRARKPRDG